MHTPSKPADPRGEPVPASETGYAVREGQLRIDDDRFELDLSPTETVVVKAAIEWDDETSKGLVETVKARRSDPVGFKASTYRGDYAALQQITAALKRYENGGAAIMEDKVAYDARTTFNHAGHVVRDRLVD